MPADKVDGLWTSLALQAALLAVAETVPDSFADGCDGNGGHFRLILSPFSNFHLLAFPRLQAVAAGGHKIKALESGKPA